MVIPGVCVFFYERGTPVLHRLARNTPCHIASQIPHYVLPLACPDHVQGTPGRLDQCAGHETQELCTRAEIHILVVGYRLLTPGLSITALLHWSGAVFCPVHELDNVSRPADHATFDVPP